MTARYKPKLVKFMTYKNGVNYSSDHTFSMEELLDITPDHVCRWMNELTYGSPEPSDDMRPVHRRSSTLEFSKKAISTVMPRVNSTWDPVTQRDNPTRSDAVNKLIKRVKKFEVRREGAESKARRSVEFDEFTNLLLLVHDMMKLQFANISPNSQYPSTLLFQMHWSKNIHEEQDAPEQIVLGSMDPKMTSASDTAMVFASGSAAKTAFTPADARAMTSGFRLSLPSSP
ncbi:hypothetical protein PHYSODRAFT_336540 [Phytophthora sojae]|uniref:Uncharacterized protein n=1 Tax=Phytophthora sojae (strain P6497) TaxID=1094619 RepID=G4ZYP1_PHYSP|nr:hypothetical protein PHYSODRAFT_336540 [Phytophthora sojae]EGZ12074.1 hypothetical protein PHYSODRAFT_336540 [Phytophthora sojae]|eukprot:XP_009532407.1 hypothetical protein PHYSODRAFT_336540 [Phytophthora sojae]